MKGVGKVSVRPSVVLAPENSCFQTLKLNVFLSSDVVFKRRDLKKYQSCFLATSIPRFKRQKSLKSQNGPPSVTEPSWYV